MLIRVSKRKGKAGKLVPELVQTRLVIEVSEIILIFSVHGNNSIACSLSERKYGRCC
jgi:hypothetical protein